jgi:hypothetical protein
LVQARAQASVQELESVWVLARESESVWVLARESESVRAPEWAQEQVSRGQPAAWR